MCDPEWVGVVLLVAALLIAGYWLENYFEGLGK